MSSPGSGSDITEQEANDLLHKLITESTKVQVVFSAVGGISAIMQGAPKLLPDGTVCIAGGTDFSSPQVIFDPRLAVSRKYGDRRAFSRPPRHLEERGAPSLESALFFGFKDGSQLLLLAIDRQQHVI